MSSSGQPSPSPLSASRQPAGRGTVLAGLRARIRTLEQGPAGRAEAAAVSLGAPLDEALPWGGLPQAGLHEVLGEPGPGDLSPATGFAAWLAARIAGPAGFILWCRPAGSKARLYGPGLAAVGLDSSRFLLVAARSPAALLWAAEEGLRSKALAAVMIKGAAPDLAAQRRLQLAAQAGGPGRPAAARPARQGSASRHPRRPRQPECRPYKWAWRPYGCWSPGGPHPLAHQRGTVRRHSR